MYRTTITQTFVVSGTVEQFDRAAFAAALALAVGLPDASHVSLAVSSASVRVVATLTVPPGVSASSVQAACAALASDPAAASAALGVTIVSISSATVATEAVPVEDETSDGEVAASATTTALVLGLAVGCGALLLLLVLANVALYRDLYRKIGRLSSALGHTSPQEWAAEGSMNQEPVAAGVLTQDDAQPLAQATSKRLWSRKAPMLKSRRGTVREDRATARGTSALREKPGRLPRARWVPNPATYHTEGAPLSAGAQLTAADELHEHGDAPERTSPSMPMASFSALAPTASSGGHTEGYTDAGADEEAALGHQVGAASRATLPPPHPVPRPLSVIGLLGAGAGVGADSLEA